MFLREKKTTLTFIIPHLILVTSIQPYSHWSSELPPTHPRLSQDWRFLGEELLWQQYICFSTAISDPFQAEFQAFSFS